MAREKKRLSILGWWIIVTVIAIIAILVYPSVFRVTQSQAHRESDKMVAKYQAAVTRCIQKNHNKLALCSTGQEGIPPVYSSWFRAIKSIHVYRGVIQVSLKLNLGEHLFIYYIPRQVRRRWFSSTTNPNSSVTWQRIESSYCGLDNKTYSCQNFMED